MILKGTEKVDLDGLFQHFNNLDEDLYDICSLYETVVTTLVDNIENRSEFKFKLPVYDREVWVFLEKKEEILKVLDYIIEHFYRFEIYELIRDFKEIRKYYETET